MPFRENEKTKNCINILVLNDIDIKLILETCGGILVVLYYVSNISQTVTTILRNVKRLLVSGK